MDVGIFLPIGSNGHHYVAGNYLEALAWRDAQAAVDVKAEDILVNKRLASAFFETNLRSLPAFHRIGTVIVTGGSTSGCLRATVVDRHGSPHFANLYDMAVRCADVLPVTEVMDSLAAMTGD